MNNDEYFLFFKKMFDIWINDKNKVKLRQIDDIYQRFAMSINHKYKNKNCSCSGNCFENFVSMDLEGELYSCNRTYHINDFYYGNINDLTLEELKKKMRKKTIDRQQYLSKSKCIECPLYSECKGGCPANAFSQHGNVFSCDDWFCEANIRIKEYIEKRIDELGLIKEYKNS